MISYDEALRIILADVTPSASQAVTLEQALGHVAAEDIYAAENIPPFHNSAMDGFAVHSELVTRASPENPAILTVDGSTMAGDDPDKGSDGAWEIMTGAAVPDAYDAVIRVEDVDILTHNAEGRPTHITIRAEGFPGKNIRAKGTDFCPEDRLLYRGQTIRANEIMALAALGQEPVSITPPPKVAIVSTGKELVDDPARPLKPGQIRNSNTPYLLQCLKTEGIPAYNAGTIFDEPDKFEQKIRDILTSDTKIILSSGAVSMGRHDFVPDGLRKMGAKILFHKTAIRPGKPILFARFPDGTYYFGLPGNPVASAVGLRFFAQPLIRALLGQHQEQPLIAVLKADFSKDSPFRFFMKARYDVGEGGRLNVEILPGQQSYKIKPMLKQNCWAIIPEDGLDVKAGNPLEIYPLFSGSFI